MALKNSDLESFRALKLFWEFYGHKTLQSGQKILGSSNYLGQELHVGQETRRRKNTRWSVGAVHVYIHLFLQSKMQKYYDILFSISYFDNVLN